MAAPTGAYPSAAQREVPANGDRLADRYTVAIIAVFAIACLWLSSGKDLWLDELFTWYQVRDKSFGELLRATDTGFNLMPAGHFLVLWCMDALGVLTQSSARWVSIAAMVAGLGVMGRLWRDCWGATTAFLLTAVLVGASFPVLAFAIEVRPYALTFLVAILALGTCRRLSKYPGDYVALTLNATYAFALPFLSYPAAVYSVSLLTAAWVAAALAGKRLPWRILASYLTGWLAFFIVSGATILRQVHSNGSGLGQMAPRISDLFQMYASLVALPVAPITVLLIASALSRRPREANLGQTVQAGEVDATIWSQSLWLLAPVGCLLLAKAAKITIWGDRFFLPTAVAIVSLAGYFFTPYIAVAVRPRRWLLAAIAVASLVSLAANGLALAGANRETPVRRFDAAINGRYGNGPVIVAELNTYFHLLHYSRTPRDLRLFSATAENKALLGSVSSRIHTVDESDLLLLRNFTMLVDAESGWANELRARFAAHGLRVVNVETVPNEFVKEIWRVEPAPTGR